MHKVGSNGICIFTDIVTGNSFPYVVFFLFGSISYDEEYKSNISTFKNYALM